MKQDKQIKLEDSFEQQLRNKVENYMDREDLKTAHLADKTELNPQTIKRWLDGKTSMSLVNYEKIHNLMEGNE